MPSTATLARLAGWSAIVLAVVAIPANMILTQFLAGANEGNAAGWVTANSSALRLAIVAILVSVVLDIVVAAALVGVFTGAGQSAVRLAAVFRFVYAGAFLVAGGMLIPALHAADEHTASSAVIGFDTLWQFALTIFGVHLFTLAWGMRASGIVPRVLVWIVGIAGVAYVAGGLVRIVMEQPGVVGATVTAIVALSSIVGELWLAIWLIVRGPRRVLDQR